MAFVRGRRDESSASISWRSPRDHPLPSPQSRPNGVSFPNPKVREVLDKVWAQRCDYDDHVTVQEQDTHPPHELLVTRTLEEMSIRDTSCFSKEAEAQMSPHLPRPVFARLFLLWQLRFFIREDRGKFLHVYPDVGGGPFQTTQEADNAISRHLDKLRCPTMCTDELSRYEICVRNTLYWPDGKRKSSKTSPKRRNLIALVHSLLDKYNDDHHLSQDLAFELEDVVSSAEIYESRSHGHMFYHINFTRKRKRADVFHIGDNNLFFAEVICLKGENEEYVLNCLCAVNPDDKGRCYGCEHNASVDLKHPTNAQKYKGGHSSPYHQCRGFNRRPLEILGDFCAYGDEEARLAAEESTIRRIFKCLDDKVFLAKLDGARRAASAVSSKREDVQGKGPRKYGLPAKLDGAARAAPVDSFKREDGHGEGSRKYYTVPAKRLEEYIVAPQLDGGSQPARLDSSKIEDGHGEVPRERYVVPAKRYVVPAKLADAATRAAPANY